MALVSPSQRFYSETLAFYTAAFFPTAFSFLFTIYCSLVSVPRVFTTEDCSLAPLEKSTITKARSQHQGS